MDELREKSIAGSAWMVAMRLTVNLLGLFSTVILARLLTPDDFGVVALAGSAYMYISLLGQFGFDIPLIQRKEVDRSYYDTAWTANILVGLCVAAAMFFVAKPAANFYQDPRIENVVYSFAALSLAKGFENIGIVNFRKQLAFRGEFYYFVVPKLSSLFFGLSAALILRNYWALVIGMIAAQVASLLYSHFSQPYRPSFSLAKFSELFKFTKWILGWKLLRYFVFNGIEIILGRMRGSVAVGYYGIASMIAYLPSTELAAPTKRALFPSFATIAGDDERLKQAFLKVFAVLMLLTMPAAFGTMAISDSLILVVFGNQWVDSGPILAVLALLAVLEVTNNLGEPIFMARGAVRTMMLVLLCHAAILLVASIALIGRFGAIGAAYAMLASAALAAPIYFLAMRREIGFTLREIVGHLWRPLTAAIAMALVVKSLETALTQNSGHGAITLVILILTGVVVYPLLLLVLWASAGRPAFPEMELLDIALTSLKRLRPTSGQAPAEDSSRG